MYFIKNILKNLDSIFCAYLGLPRYQIKPETVELISGNLFIKNTEFNKRHLQKNLFNDINLSHYSDEDRNKLGKAIGKLIATNLVIKFVK